MNIHSLWKYLSILSFPFKSQPHKTASIVIPRKYSNLGMVTQEICMLHQIAPLSTSTSLMYTVLLRIWITRFGCRTERSSILITIPLPWFPAVSHISRTPKRVQRSYILQIVKRLSSLRGYQVKKSNPTFIFPNVVKQLSLTVQANSFKLWT